MAASSDYPEVVKATRSTRSLDNSEACYGDTSIPVLHVTLLGGEWGSSAGGLSTINRELAIHLSNHSAVKISLLVPEGACNTEEIREADGYGITIVEAKERTAYDRLDWLSIPPQDHFMDIVVGHGVKLGRQVQFIRDSVQFSNCKWVQVVHTAPEDLSRYKCYRDPISKGETKHESEVGLCKLADLVVPVGPRLKEAYCSYLQRRKTDQDVLSITPGLFQREFGDLVAKQEPNEDGEFKVLLFGRGDDEDFELKGYNIAAQAFTDQRLNNKCYHLIFVGAPEGKQEEVREKLLQCGIVEAQLTVRKFMQGRERLKDLLCEADIAIMPSKSEGFGLVALEALSAGLPILVGSRSGFAKALENVLHGDACIVNSDDPAEWAKAIEAVRLKHGMRLQEIKSLRASYGEMYSWKEQCEALVNRMRRMGHDASDIPKDVSVTEKQPVAKTHASASGFSGEQCPVDEQPKTKDLVRLSEESPSTCHTPSISGLTSDQEAENTIKMSITPRGLSSELEDVVDRMFRQQLEVYLKYNKRNKLSTASGLSDFLKHVEDTYNFTLTSVGMGSLVIKGQCPDLQSLESLWNDYCSGVLNEAAERFLVTDDMKKEINLVTLRLKTTIEEESYLTCKKALMEKSAISRSVPPTTESDQEAASPLIDTSPDDSEEKPLLMYPRLLSSGKPRETGATRICYSRETILALNPNRERNIIGTGTAGRGRHGSGFGRVEGREGGGGGKRGREEDGAQGHNPLLALNPNRERNVIGTGTAGRGGHGSGFGRGEGRGGGGRSAREEDGAQGHNPRQIRLGFKALQELDTKTPDEIILDLMSSRRFPATEFLLTQQSSMKDDWIVLTVSIVAKACSCNSKEYLIKLLNLLPKSLFFTSHLRTFLNRLSACRMPATEVATFLRNVLRIMKELLRIFPNSYADLPVSELYCGIRIFSETQQPDGALVAEGEELMQLRNQKADELKKQEEENQYRRRPRRDAGENDDAEPPDNFREYSVIPTQQDILTGERPFLRRNKTDGSYNDAEHYLDVQFRLLREDFVRPLREGIAKLLERIGSAKIGALQDIRVYKDVRLLYPICTTDGLRYRIKFDNTRLRNVRWENSKRLIFGSLMCLSKDKFESFVFATIANRDAKELKQGIVDIQFINLSDYVRLEEGDVFQMVESTVYFEAYRHILEGLKEVDPRRLPLQKYIVNCEKEVDPPAYLRNRYRGRVTFDLTPIMKKQTGNSASSSYLTQLRARLAGLNLQDDPCRGSDVPILSLAYWPSAKDLELDDSQYRALQMALTKEFAVIQGPPGTGKTYIGLKIANVLLHNKTKWDTGTELLDDNMDDRLQVSERRPILVVCYTNHALDQFLEGIHKFHPQGIVRIGGRSKSDIMKECSLSERKFKMHKDKSAPVHIRRAFYDAHQEMDHTTAKLQSAAEELQRCFENLLHEDDLHQRASSMTTLQYQSLKEPFDGLVARRDSAILHWLQLSLSSANPASVQPVAVFPLNSHCGGLERVSRANLATLSGVAWAPGLDGVQGGSIQLRGTPASFVEIPNRAGSDLDTRTSITLLMHVFPVGNRGPILCFHEDGLGVQIWQEGLEEGKGILTARFVCRDFSQPLALTKAVLTMNAWNFIGASYDHDSGIASLWHDGNAVDAKFIGSKMELATQFSIRIGAIASAGPGHCFQGRFRELYIFNESLGREMIRTVGGIAQEGGAEAQDGDDEGGEEEEEDDTEDLDVVYEADVMQDQRLLDNDDVRVFGTKSAGLKGARLKVVNPFAFDGGSDDGWQVQNAAQLKKRLKRTIIQQLSKKDFMPDERAKMVRNVWRLSVNDRWSLYRRWLKDVSDGYRQTISLFQEQFEAGAKRLKDIKNMEDFEILKNADVVGMTTTGAAKFRKLLQRLKPRITIVEEAAEVLESHIVTSLTSGCQHLILIGDHQQLRPNPTVFELAKHYSLDVSLFERMVKTGMPFERLRLQHRMRPEISKMLDHIYFNPKLENHESVLNFENIKGVNRNIFFVDHDESEEYQEEGRSRSNEHEAKFVAALCRYLILQGYEREKITVLTAYTGQLIQLKKEMPKDFFRGVRVCAVDNFQGEENDIILLSLVRSNEDGKIGFLQTDNRVCVALSRAKKGFYCIGNISLLKEKSDLWRKIMDDMEERGNVGNALTLSCQNHPRNVIQASCADDFKKAPEGGCTVPCVTRLACGHVCEMVCHPTDPEHKEYECKKPCEKIICTRNHKCPRLCYQDCGPCMKPVTKILPGCGHTQSVPCYKDPSEVKCTSPCPKFLPACGHPCQNICSDECTVECTAITLKTWPCGHENETACHVNPMQTPCEAPCGETLKCEHPCVGNCGLCFRGRVHVPCKAYCGRTLFCGHSCSEPCTKNCPPCKEPCGNSCTHSKCHETCGEPCEPCNEKCSWQCLHHRCTRLCGQPCNRQRCNEPCKKLLTCKHPCIGLCGEICPKKCRVCHKDEVTEIFFGTEDDEDARFVELADCGHVFEVEMMDQWMDQAEAGDDGKAVNVQLKRCPKCSTPIRTSLRYGNIIKKILADFEKIKRKIILGKQQREEAVSGLMLKAQSIEAFPNDNEEIVKSLLRTNLTDEQVNVFENQISLLSFLQEIKVKIHKGEKAESERAQESYHSLRLLQETKEELDSLVEKLRFRVMRTRARFSDQELEELKEEMYRTQLAVDLKILHMQLDIRRKKLNVIDSVQIGQIQRALDYEKVIDQDTRKRYTARIERIRESFGLQVFYQNVTREEKDIIVKAMGLAQGHWFKCPKGHIYCITECGGAMEEDRCPECGSTIGGHNHRLRHDNQLARDMDGARYAAFSDMANINNFDPRDFDR